MNTKTYVLREIQIEYQDIEEAIEAVVDGYLEFAANPQALQEVKKMHFGLKDRLRINRMAFLYALDRFGGQAREIALTVLSKKQE